MLWNRSSKTSGPGGRFSRTGILFKARSRMKKMFYFSPIFIFRWLPNFVKCSRHLVLSQNLNPKWFQFLKLQNMLDIQLSQARLLIGLLLGHFMVMAVRETLIKVFSIHGTDNQVYFTICQKFVPNQMVNWRLLKDWQTLKVLRSGINSL